MHELYKRFRGICFKIVLKPFSVTSFCSKYLEKQVFRFYFLTLCWPHARPLDIVLSHMDIHGPDLMKLFSVVGARCREM